MMTVLSPVPPVSEAPLSLVVGDGVRVDVDPSRVSPLWFATVVDALSRRSA